MDRFIMKAIIFSHDHDRGGSYVMDPEGCFHFVKGFSSHPIGTEIEIKTRQTELNQKILKNFRKIASVAACFLVVLSLGYFTLMWNFINTDIGAGPGDGFEFIDEDTPLSRPPVSRSTSGNYEYPPVSAEITVEFIIFRSITVILTGNDEIYTKNFRELNRSNEGTYIIEGEDGVYTVYITFSKNTVQTAEIIDFEAF